MARDASGFDSTDLTLAAGLVDLAANLTLPRGAMGLVVFAHGTGSSRYSRRDRLVAHQLAESGLATLLFDLVTPAEEEEEDRSTGALRFDVGFLAGRLGEVTEYVRRHSDTRRLRVGYFGAGTGAAAALCAAADRPGVVGAVVSRGGRPDLAGAALEKVVAPTLLIIGSDDHPALELNQQAYLRLQCSKRLEIIPGAMHAFEQPGALQTVGSLACIWFRHFFEHVAPGALLGAPPPHPPTR